jgi:hypothetical protein
VTALLEAPVLVGSTTPRLSTPPLVKGPPGRMRVRLRAHPCDVARLPAGGVRPGHRRRRAAPVAAPPGDSPSRTAAEWRLSFPHASLILIARQSGKTHFVKILALLSDVSRRRSAGPGRCAEPGHRPRGVVRGRRPGERRRRLGGGGRPSAFVMRMANSALPCIPARVIGSRPPRGALAVACRSTCSSSTSCASTATWGLVGAVEDDDGPSELDRRGHLQRGR